MKNRTIILIWMVLMMVVSSACGMLSTPTPTATATVPPTDTETPAPTATRIPRPTSTPTVEPTPSYGELTEISEGGFSFRPPQNFSVDVQGPMVGILDDENEMLFALFGVTNDPQQMTADKMIKDLADSIFSRANGDYSLENQRDIQIAGAGGIAYDINGTMDDKAVAGQIVFLVPAEDQYLCGIGLADSDKWPTRGIQLFEGMLATIAFTSPAAGETASSCTISTDDTYAFTQENAVKVGGDAFEGPARERAYLDNLLGPNGEPVTYTRTGSLPYEDTILDAFELTVAGQKYTIYIDEYVYSEPYAPIGFTCAGEFPLSQP